MKNLIQTIILCLTSLLGTAQENSVMLSGKITDDQTGKPLQAAYVFLNNSSLATQTDENGNFEIEKLPVGDLDIRVSFLGYETLKQDLRFEEPGLKEVSFKLKQGIDLPEFVVRGKKDKKREKLLKIITTELLGESRFKKQCKILNPEVLRIYDDEDGHLRAKSAAPLIIENHGLGYRIFQDIEDFNLFGSRVYYGGSTRFESLAPQDDKQKTDWKANQKEAFQGSLKHLLVSVASNTMDQQGFKIYQVKDSLAKQIITLGDVKKPRISEPEANMIEVNASNFIRKGKLDSERILTSALPMEIFFIKRRGTSPYSDMHYAYSKIFFPQKQIVFTTEGWVVQPMGFFVDGDLAFDRLSTLLPADWKEQ